MHEFSVSRVRVRAAWTALPLIVIASGCDSQMATTHHQLAALSHHQPSMQVVIAASDLAVGRNRFTFGLLDNNHPLKGGQPRLTFYSIKGQAATAVESTVARFNYFARGLQDTNANSAAIELGGVYVAYPTFSHAGSWGVEVRMPYKGTTQVLRAGFSVSAHSLTPAIGSQAPRSNNPTVYQEPATKLDSGRPPDDMHRLSIAQAIAQRKPLVVLFATAGFCTSRMCGPEIQVVEGLEHQYRGRVNFVHIEIYKDANPAHGYAPAVLQWRLQTEPWVFVVNGKGIIVDKFEGPTTGSEIAPAIQAAVRF